MRPYSPGGALIALASTRKGSIPPASSAHRLRRGLPGYLILFAPHAFAPQRQTKPSKPPSPPVFFRISTHSTATPGIPLASTRLQPPSISGGHGVEPRHFTDRLKRPPARALRPVIPNNARTMYYRGCWHRVSRCFLWGYRQNAGIASRARSSPPTAVYTPKSFLPHAASLRQAFAHCARFPTAASRRSLGRISVPMWPIILSDRLRVVALVSRYPHQLADTPRAPPRTLPCRSFPQGVTRPRERMRY